MASISNTTITYETEWAPVTSGDSAVNNLITLGGILTISGGIAVNNTVSDGGLLQVISGTATGTVVNAGGGMLVDSGGTATGTTVNAGGGMMVDSGGTATQTTVNDGGFLEVSSGGTATGFAIAENGGLMFYDVDPKTHLQGTSAGSAVLLESGHLSGYRLESNTINVWNGGSTSEIELLSGGVLNVWNGGSASATTVNNEGDLKVKNGGTATGTTVNSDGDMYVSASGTASSTVINDNGYMLVSGSSALANETVLNSGGSMFVERNGSAHGVTVNNKGCLTVSSDGFADEIIENGGFVQIAAGASAVFASHTFSGAVLAGNSALLDLHRATVHSGTTAIGTIVNYADLSVCGGTAIGTTVNSGGQISVSTGLVADTLIADGGSLRVSSGTVTGTLNIASEGHVWGENAVLNFDVSPFKRTSTARVNDLSLVENNFTYSITVSAVQMTGTYTLAEGASAFDSAITIGTTESEYGVLAVNGDALTVGVRRYQLLKTDGVLSLQVSSDDMTAPVIQVSASTEGLTKQPVLLTASATDTNGVDSLEYSMDGTVWNEYTAPVSVIANGTVYFRATDTLGNVSQNTSYEVSNIQEGTSISNTTITYETEWDPVTSGDSAVNNLITLDGILTINGGIAVNNTVSDGGLLHVISGTATGTVVNADGGLWVDSDATATQTTVNAGGGMMVDSGGTATQTTVNDGGSLVVSSGGSATGFAVAENGNLIFDVDPQTYLQGTSAGSAVLLENGHLSGYRLESNVMNVWDGGSTSEINVLSGGVLNVQNGGSASATTVNNEGDLKVKNGGTATGTTVNSGGDMYVSASGTASSTVINDNGYMLVSGSSALANGTVLNSGGSMFVERNGSAHGVTVNNKGCLSVSSAGFADEIIENGGFVQIAAGASAVFASHTFSGAVLSGNSALLELHRATVHSGTTAIGTIVNDYADLSVCGGTAIGTTVNSGGQISVSTGLVADTLIADGGSLLVSSGTVTGTLNIASEGLVLGMENAVLNFDVSQFKRTSTARVNDLSLVKNKFTYSITVSAIQMAGTYALAEGASAFDSAITIGTEESVYGVLAVNGDALTVGVRRYQLLKTDGVLSLQVSSDDMTAPVIQVSASTEGLTKQPVLLTASATDPNGVDSLEYSMDGTIWNEYTAPVSVSANGTVYFRAADTLGNVSQNTSYEVSNIQEGTSISNTTITAPVTIKSGESAKQIVISSGGILTVGSDASADFITVNNGGKLVLKNDAAAKNTTVGSGGILEVSGGVLDGLTVNAGGTVYVGDDSIITGSMQIADGATVRVSPGVGFVFDLTNRTDKDDALINDFSRITFVENIQGFSDSARNTSENIQKASESAPLSVSINKCPEYTIIINSNQAIGDYALADSAAAFTSSVTVMTKNDLSAVLTVGSSVQLDDLTCSLSIKSDRLTFSISPMTPEPIDPALPDAPDGLSTSVKKHNTQLVWDKVKAIKGVTVSYEIWMDGEIFTSKRNKYTFKNTEAGTHSFAVRTVLSDGTVSNWSNFVKETVADITPPKIGSLTLNQTDSNTVRLEWAEADDDVGIDHYVVTCGNESKTVSGSILSTEFKGVAGKVNATLTAYDAAGNASKTVKKSLKIADVSAPTQVTGLKSKGVNNKSGGVLTWNPASDNVGVTQYLIAVEGQKTYKSKTNSVKVKKMPAGSYKFTVTALDKAKNQSIVSEECTFTVADVIDPKVKKLSAKVADDSAFVTWNAIDETGIAKLELSLDGQKDIDVTNLGSYGFEGLSVGVHSLRLTAFDAAGNMAFKDAKLNVKAPKNAGLLAAV